MTITSRITIRIGTSTWIAILIVAAQAHSTWARGQIHPENLPKTVCLEPADVLPVQLYGLWRAEFEGLSQPATVLFEKHPELASSIVGGVTRNGSKTLAAGDVDNGVFSLEESDNGQTITATWNGALVEGSCGKEIIGTWNNAISNTSHRFVLRKQPGWQ